MTHAVRLQLANLVRQRNIPLVIDFMAGDRTPEIYTAAPEGDESCKEALASVAISGTLRP